MSKTKSIVSASAVNTLSFRADRSIQTEETKIKLLLKTEQIRVYTVAIPCAHFCWHYSSVEQEKQGQKPAVLAESAEWGLSDFFFGGGGIF